jgi:2-methylcitrate dehydratase PrpD
MEKYLLDVLAEFCAGARYESLPEKIIHQTKHCVLDLIACG